MKFFSAIKYYFFSLPKILRGTNFWVLPFLLIKKPQLLKLTVGYKFLVGSLLDALTIKEVVLDDCYKCFREKYETIINVGSGVGDFDVMMSETAARIFSFDGSQNRAKLLKRNLELNKIRNVVFENRFVKTLDDIFQKNKIESCDLLKIDCEGAEYEIFNRTSDEVLRKIKKIVGEIHLFNEDMKTAYKKLIIRLTTMGFGIEEKENPVHDYILFIYCKR